MHQFKNRVCYWVQKINGPSTVPPLQSYFIDTFFQVEYVCWSWRRVSLMRGPLSTISTWHPPKHNGCYSNMIVEFKDIKHIDDEILNKCEFHYSVFEELTTFNAK